MGEFALGQPVPRLEDPRLLRGGGRYVDDVKLPGTAYGYVLRSPHAHAKILRLDTAAAKRAPGVLLVLTHADWKASGFGQLPTTSNQKRRDGSPNYSHPTPPLVDGRVRRVGDTVAFVVAETLPQAMDAAELIEIDYEPLPSVSDTATAGDPGQPRVWDDCPDNVAFVHRVGDQAAVDAAMAKAAHVARRRFVINRVSANTIEPRGCTADYNRAADHYTLYTTLQGVHPYRSTIANRILKVPESHVRVIAGDIGGSFGMKSGVYAEVVLVLLASKLLARPVKWTSTRTEALLSDNHGRDNVTDVALALDKDGKFLGMSVKTIANLGAYLVSTSAAGPANNLGGLAGVYTTPAIHVDVTGVFTNTNSTCPYRGAGRPEASFVVERIIDVAASELGIDPVELRRRNTIPPGALPFKSGLILTYDVGEFEKNMDMALKMVDYANFETRRAEARKRGKLRGIGLSNTIERSAGGGIEAAEIRFDRSGTATLLMGSLSQGQSHETVFKQLVCDHLGLKPDDVAYVTGDTDKVAFGHGTGGSRSAALGGGAAHLAATKIVEKAKRIAAHMLEASVDDIEVKEGVYTIAGTDRKLTIKEIAKAAVDPKNIPDGLEPGLVVSAVFNNKKAGFPNGCHVCEVEIDEETGAVQVVDYKAVSDTGTVMNPLTLKGQIQGGAIQGVGQILMENIAYDNETGQLLSASFMDYCMPRADDLSSIEVDYNEVKSPSNPLGIKGAGEAGNNGGLPAAANAVANALKPLGVDHLDMPTTPERVWRAIQRAKAARA